MCRRWFSAAVCNPAAFRRPVEEWCQRACTDLDAQLLRLEEPPADEVVEHLLVGLQHADEELKITDQTASFPDGVTVMLLKYARQLSTFLCWLHLERSAGDGGAHEADVQYCFFKLEAAELRRRIALLLAVGRQLQQRLPDPDMPVRWAKWLEGAENSVGLPDEHRARFRQQREQTSQVWSNNQRALRSTVEHIRSLATSLGELEALCETGNVRNSSPELCSGADFDVVTVPAAKPVLAPQRALRRRVRPGSDAEEEDDA